MRLFTTLVLLAQLVLPLPGRAGETVDAAQPKFPVPGTDGRWFVDQAKRTGDARIAPHLGRAALWLKNNSHVMLEDQPFRDGVITFDLAPMPEGQFFALLFRRASFRHFENIYFRAHRSGQSSALQYAPAINGSSTWQLYPQFSRAIDIVPGRWTRVRLKVTGSRMQLWLDDAEQPVLEVPRLRSEAAEGYVAVWARRNRAPDTWAAAVADLRVVHRQAAPRAAGATRDPGMLNRWRVSAPFALEGDTPLVLPNVDGWQEVVAEEAGLVNLTRALGAQRGRWGAVVETVIDGGEGGPVLLDAGWSDDATVFLNGVPLFRGRNGWQARFAEDMGYVGTGTQQLVLPLRRGPNRLALVVANRRFGWGLAARVVPAGPGTNAGP